MNTSIVNNVDHPAHYTRGEIECIDAIDAATEGLSGGVAFCLGNVIKYVWRYRWKNGLEDLKKAKWYLCRAIMMIEKKQVNRSACINETEEI